MDLSFFVASENAPLAPTVVVVLITTALSLIEEVIEQYYGRDQRGTFQALHWERQGIAHGAEE